MVDGDVELKTIRKACELDTNTAKVTQCCNHAYNSWEDRRYFPGCAPGNAEDNAMYMPDTGEPVCCACNHASVQQTTYMAAPEFMQLYTNCMKK